MDELCLSLYKRLLGEWKRKSPRKWTVLAGIVIETSDGLKVISLATGLKCLKPSAIHGRGQLIHDSHAEVLARRGAIRYLMKEVISVQSGSQSQIFDQNLQIRPGVKFHMYISRPPCGDASMTMLLREDEDKTVEYLDSSVLIRGRLDIRKLGAMRTKPGRIDAETTDSLSCSDKLTLWNCVGFQGALLHQMVGSLFISTLTVGSYMDISELQRALVNRCKGMGSIRLNQASAQFEYDQDETPPEDVSFVYVEGDRLEKIVNGARKQVRWYKQGLLYPSSVSTVSRQRLLGLYQKATLQKDLTYRQCKDLSQDYQQLKRKVLNEIFKNWPRNKNDCNFR